MSGLLQRITDWRLERRIRQFSSLTLRAVHAGNRSLARQYLADMTALIGQRSPGQIERAERRMGLR